MSSLRTLSPRCLHSGQPPEPRFVRVFPNHCSAWAAKPPSDQNPSAPHQARTTLLYTLPPPIALLQHSRCSVTYLPTAITNKPVALCTADRVARRAVPAPFYFPSFHPRLMGQDFTHSPTQTLSAVQSLPLCHWLKDSSLPAPAPPAYQACTLLLCTCENYIPGASLVLLPSPCPAIFCSVWPPPSSPAEVSEFPCSIFILQNFIGVGPRLWCLCFSFDAFLLADSNPPPSFLRQIPLTDAHIFPVACCRAALS